MNTPIALRQPVFSFLQRPRAGLRAAVAAPLARTLVRGDTTWVQRPLGRRISCHSGRVWLTFDGVAQELVLDAGESHECLHATPLAVHAFSAARFSVD